VYRKFSIHSSFWFANIELKIYISAAVCGKFKNEIEKKFFQGHQASVTLSHDLEDLQAI
jgi:hypothetical protein